MAKATGAKGAVLDVVSMPAFSQPPFHRFRKRRRAAGSAARRREGSGGEPWTHRMSRMPVDLSVRVSTAAR